MLSFRQPGELQRGDFAREPDRLREFALPFTLYRVALGVVALGGRGVIQLVVSLRLDGLSGFEISAWLRLPDELRTKRLCSSSIGFISGWVRLGSPAGVLFRASFSATQSEPFPYRADRRFGRRCIFSAVRLSPPQVHSFPAEWFQRVGVEAEATGPSCAGGIRPLVWADPCSRRRSARRCCPVSVGVPVIQPGSPTPSPAVRSAARR